MRGQWEVGVGGENLNLIEESVHLQSFRAINKDPTPASLGAAPRVRSTLAGREARHSLSAHKKLQVLRPAS